MGALLSLAPNPIDTRALATRALATVPESAGRGDMQGKATPGLGALGGGIAGAIGGLLGALGEAAVEEGTEHAGEAVGGGATAAEGATAAAEEAEQKAAAAKEAAKEKAEGDAAYEELRAREEQARIDAEKQAQDEAEEALRAANNYWEKPETLAGHYAEHGEGVGATSKEEYARMAHELYPNKGQYQEKVDEKGITRVYDAARNLFGSYNPDGTTRTLFAPPEARPTSTGSDGPCRDARTRGDMTWERTYARSADTTGWTSPPSTRGVPARTASARAAASSSASVTSPTRTGRGSSPSGASAGPTAAACGSSRRTGCPPKAGTHRRSWHAPVA